MTRVMNIACMLLVISGALVLVGLGLASLVHDLLGRGPHDAPLIEDDGLNWPPRYQGSVSRTEAGVKLGDVEVCSGARR